MMITTPHALCFAMGAVPASARTAGVSFAALLPTAG